MNANEFFWLMDYTISEAVEYLSKESRKTGLDIDYIEHLTEAVIAHIYEEMEKNK